MGPPPTAPGAPASAPVPARPAAAAAQAPATYRCPYCGTNAVNPGRSCPGCGAPVDVRELVSDSGWVELPGARDMARIQFGRSDCQISGTLVPAADMNLADGEGVYFPHHVLLWKDTNVEIGTMRLAGGFSRFFAGLPLIMTQAQGPGHIAFSMDRPGETIAVPLAPGQSIDVREHHLLVASNSINYGWFQTPVWYTTSDGDNSETHYPMGMFMDRFQPSQGPGLVLLHASGNAFMRTLAPGEQILVKPTAVLYTDSSVQSHLTFEYAPGGSGSLWRPWVQVYMWVRLVGPGRVAVESAFEMLEETGRYIVSQSY